MSAAITAAVVVGGATVYAAKKGAKAADRAASSADAAAQLQFEISQQQVDLAKEQWGVYKGKILPQEIEMQKLGLQGQELAIARQELDQRIYEQYYAPLQESFAAEAMEGIEAQPERAAREARMAVDRSFETEEGMRQRQLERRGVRPGTDSAYESGMADTSLARAAAKGFAVNRAVEAERDRVEDVNFARKAAALGRSPGALGIQGAAAGINANSAAAGLAAAGTTAYGAGAQSARQAGMYGDATAGALSGGIQLGMQAYDLFNRYKTPTPSPGVDIGFNPTSFTPTTTQAPPTSSLNVGGAGGGGASSIDIGFSPTGFAEGGMVETPMLARPGYAQGGTVTGPPGYDQVPAGIQQPDGSMVPARLTNGEFVIPADVVAAVGTNPLEDIIEKARARKADRNAPKNALSRPGRG